MEIANVTVRHDNQSRSAKARIYFWPGKETVMENLVNRRSRPYNEFRKLMPQVFAKLRDEGVLSADVTPKVRWSQYAGCSCPCSPGFIVDDYYMARRTISVELA